MNGYYRSRGGLAPLPGTGENGPAGVRAEDFGLAVVQFEPEAFAGKLDRVQVKLGLGAREFRPG